MVPSRFDEYLQHLIAGLEVEVISSEDDEAVLARGVHQRIRQQAK
jgi:hypothetical protein